MRFTMTIDSNDDDATDNPRGLVAMVLREVGLRVGEYVADGGTIRDGNGVTIGTWSLETDQ